MNRLTTRLRTLTAAAATTALLAGCGVGATSAGSDATGSTTVITAQAASNSSGTTSTTAESTTATTEGTATSSTGEGIGAVGLTTHADGDEGDYDAASAVTITLQDGGSTADGDGVEVGTTGSGRDLVTITSAGTYVLSGTLTDGQVVLDVPEEEDVTLVLDDASITSTQGSAVHVAQADDATVVLAEGSDNYLADPATYAQTEPEVDETTGEEIDIPNAALYSTADLTIAGTGALTVEGYANDGITSKDGLVVLSGDLTVRAVDDGIRGKDFLSVQGGTLDVTANGDGLKSDNTDEGTGIIAVSGAETTVTVAAGDDAVKAENVVDIVDGTLTVTQSLEGIEAARIVVEGGTTSVTSTDDAVNGASDLTAASVEITGGTLTLDAEGDGLDSNGTVTMTGGTVVVNGPTGNGNGSLDVDGEFLVSGGTLVAIGSAGMLVGPSTSSEQASIVATLSGTVSAGRTMTVTAADGTTVAEVAVGKDTQSLVLSSADLVAGESYTVSVDGSTVATATAGEYAAGGMGGMGGPGGGARP